MAGLTSREEIDQLIATKSWYHKFEIVPGIFTPGLSDFNAEGILDAAGITGELQGKRALDIGTWDGPMAFELEKRGAAVTALDIQDPDNTGFNVAKRILGSSARYVKGTVYDLPDLIKDKQDLVIFRGVFYHLKYPIMAFEKISEIMAHDGLLYFEGECALHYAEDLEGKQFRIDFGALNDMQIPLTLCYPNKYKDGSNWFIPNLACLKSWMATSGLEVISHTYYSVPDLEPYPAQRIYGLARKVRELSSEIEHPVFQNKWR